jgi:lysyl-tRNA synthetase class 1
VGRAGCGTGDSMSILDGKVKVGWKADWALRWYVLQVQYEMYGKDLIESAGLSADICKIISGRKGPVQSFYEMFLDEEGRKISKSVGKGLTVDAWLTYAPKESLLLFILKDPRKAKRLSWDSLVRSADEYLQLLQRRYTDEQPPVAETPGGNDHGPNRQELDFIQPDVPQANPYAYPVSYSMLLGLIGAIGVPAPEVVMEYVHHYKGAVPASDPMLQRLIELATAFVRDQVLPARTARTLSSDEARLVKILADFLHEEDRPSPDLSPEEIQTKVFDIARDGGVEAKPFFRLIYNLLTGQDSGPRLGTFVKLMGQGKVAAILRKAASGPSRGTP